VQHQQPDSRAWNGDLAPEINPTLARITASPGGGGGRGCFVALGLWGGGGSIRRVWRG